MAANESAPLLSRRMRASNLTLYLLAGIGLIALSSFLLVSDRRPTRAVLMQARSGRRAQLAQALIMKGKDLMDAGRADIRMARLIEGNVFKGSMLSGNETTPKCTGDVLECKGVNLDNWPHYHEISSLPGYVSPSEGGAGGGNSTEPNEVPDDVADYDLYNRKPLERAGVHVGRWFWEDEDDGIEDESAKSNETSAAEEAADEELQKIMQKMENQTTPEERLSRLGVKLEGMPWDNEQDDEDVRFALFLRATLPLALTSLLPFLFLISTRCPIPPRCGYFSTTATSLSFNSPSAPTLDSFPFPLPRLIS
eukprot:746715-Hanusia_phi.AAC.5